MIWREVTHIILDIYLINRAHSGNPNDTLEANVMWASNLGKQRTSDQINILMYLIRVLRKYDLTNNLTILTILTIFHNYIFNVVRILTIIDNFDNKKTTTVTKTTQLVTFETLLQF